MAVKNSGQWDTLQGSLTTTVKMNGVKNATRHKELRGEIKNVETPASSSSLHLRVGLCHPWSLRLNWVSLIANKSRGMISGSSIYNYPAMIGMR
jgi:hypothetical protein